jgi:hypothetical protein
LLIREYYNQMGAYSPHFCVIRIRDFMLNSPPD